MFSLIIENKGFTDFAPMDFGFEACRAGKVFGPHVRDYYLIHYVETGCGVFESPRGTGPVSAGEAFLIRPGEVCTYRADKTHPWHYTWIGFVGKLSPAFDRLDPVFPAEGAIFAEMRALPETMAEEHLCAMLFQLYRSLFADRARPNYVNRVIAYINAHYMEDISIEGIAASLSLNRKYLSRLFRETTGQTMQAFLIDKRMREARGFLSGGHSVAETALLCGYRDPLTFSRAFHRHEGCAPSAHRKRT